MQRLQRCTPLLGYSFPKYFEEIPNSEFERQMRVNYLGCVYSSKAVLPYMKKNGALTSVRAQAHSHSACPSCDQADVS